MRLPAIIVVITCSSAAFASQSYRPPEGGEVWQITKVFLKPYQLGRKDARGVVAFICNEAESQHIVQCYAKNLRPGQAYSLWLLRRAPDGEWQKLKRLSRRLRPPRANDRGELRLKASQSQCPLSAADAVGLWQEPPRGAAGEPGWELLGEIRHEQRPSAPIE